MDVARATHGRLDDIAANAYGNATPLSAEETTFRGAPLPRLLIARAWHCVPASLPLM